MKAKFSALKESPKMVEAFALIESERERTLQEQMELAAIPAPSNEETAKAKRYFAMFEALEFFDEVRMDEVENVIGLVKGSGGGPTLVVAAHTDTVFHGVTETTPERRDGIVYGPGISDDTRGMVEILAMVRALKATGMRPVGDILFVGNVGEESLGDLRGSKHLFKTMGDQIDGFLTVDAGPIGALIYNATGSYKVKAVFSGTGGHSFGVFGIPNAIHAAGRAIAKISDLETPTDPKTTFNVGIVHGGTAVNAIASEVELMIDMRSNDMGPLDLLAGQIEEALLAGCREENARWNHPDEVVKVQIDRVGARPAGMQPGDSILPDACIAAYEAFGVEPNISPAASTDCNVPLSMGIPAAAIGMGGVAKFVHTVSEQYDPEGDYLGVQRNLLLTVGLVGLDGISEPILPKRR